MRTQADLVDQLFNSSEKRLARILLLMAEFGMPGEPEPQIPPITQETLAEMIGTTRSRVSFFMNRFRKLGLIEYTSTIPSSREHVSTDSPPGIRRGPRTRPSGIRPKNGWKACVLKTSTGSIAGTGL
jgi:hypothetical protein